MPPARRMRLIARRWWAWPASAGSPAVEIHAQAGAEQGLLDVVRGQGVAGEQHVDVAPRISWQNLAAAGVHDGRPGRPPGSCRPLARFSASSRATARMATPLGFSVETVLPMNSNVCAFGASAPRETRARRRAPRRSRRRRRTSFIGRHRPSASAASTTMPQSISWSSTAIHFPARRISVRWLVVL